MGRDGMGVGKGSERDWNRQEKTGPGEQDGNRLDGMVGDRIGLGGRGRDETKLDGARQGGQSGAGWS